MASIKKKPYRQEDRGYLFLSADLSCRSDISVGFCLRIFLRMHREKREFCIQKILLQSDIFCSSVRAESLFHNYDGTFHS